jgi:hypothetical protein
MSGRALREGKSRRGGSGKREAVEARRKRPPQEHAFDVDSTIQNRDELPTDGETI